MKITPEHLSHLKAACMPLVTPERIERFETGQFPRSDRVKDLNVRFRWDTLHAANLTPWITQTLYPYVNDDHIDTALRRILPTITRRY